MTLQCVWLLEDQLIYIRLSGTVDTQDLRSGNAIISRYLAESKSRSIHLLFDCREVKQINLGVVQIHLELQYLQHPSLGWIVIFGMNRSVEQMIGFLTSVILRLTKLRVREVGTLDEALDFLRSADPSLPAIIPSVDVST